MADGDLLGGKDAGGGVSPKRARSLGAAAAAAADVGGAPATTLTAGDGDALQFLLEGLSPSPIKKVKRSSGDLLDATGEDGKVLPELLSDHGGNTVTSTWPKPSTRRQVLTFGASWDNRSDVDFLNRVANPASADFALPDVGNGSKGVGGGGTTRRHSDPPLGTRTSSMMMSSSSSMTSSSTATRTSSSSSSLRRGTPTGLSVNGGTAAAAAAVASGPAAHGVPAQRRRPNSTGSISVNGNGGSSSRSGGSSYAAYSSSVSANAKRHLANLAAISTNGVAAAGGGPAWRGGSGRQQKQQQQQQQQRQYQGGGVPKANENNPNLVNEMGSGMKPAGSGGGLSEAKMEMMEMDAAALLLPQVDVRDMRLTTTSPAGSVESDFWGDGDGDDGIENDGFDPMEAAHAAVDRLMGSTTSPMSTAGNTTSHAALGGGDADGDTRLLEDLLLDGLGLRHMEAEPSGGVVTAASRSSSRRGAAAGAGAAGQSRPANASGGGGGVSSNSTLDDFPTTPASSKNASDADKPGTKAKGDNGSGAGGRTSGGGGGGSGGRKNRLSPGSLASSASSTPLSVLSSNSSTPQSAGDGSQTSPGSIAAMTLNPSLWKLVERGETCPFQDCAFTVAFFERKEARKAAAAAAAAAGGGGGGGGVGAGMLKEEGEEDNDKENRSRCRHFHTLCGCRHTRGVLKGRLFQTNQLDKARNHQKKHAHADAAAAAAAASSTAAAAAAAPSPATAGGHGMARPAAETPSPVPSMAMPSSQESAGSSYFWGSQPDEPLSQGQQRQAQQDAIYSSSQPLFGQGRGDTAVGGVGADGGADGRVRCHGGHDRDRDSVAMEDAGPSSTLPIDDREDESGIESTAGGKSPHPKKAAKARGRGRGAVKSRRGGLDGGGSDTSCSKEKDTSRDGRRTWTDAESDRLREVVEHRSAGDSRKNWQWVAAKVSEVSPRGPGDSEGGTLHPDGGINPNRKTPSQCKMRWERILNPGVKRGLWTKEEDQKLKEVAAAMEYKWSHVAKLMGGRTYKQCRERYTNYLKEGLNVGPWTKEEDQLLLSMHAKVGNKWAEIARYLKDRSENMIKNEYMKLSRDANASQRRRQAHLDNTISHNQNNLDSNTNPNGHEDVISGRPTAGEGGDGEAAKAKKRKGKQPLKGTGGPVSSSSSTTPLPDGDAERRHSAGDLWGVTPAPIGTVGVSFPAAARSAESSSFLGEPPAVKLEQQYQHQQQQWQQQQQQQQQQLHGPAGFLVPSSAAGGGLFPATTAASMAITNPAGGALGVGNIGFPPRAATAGDRSGDGSRDGSGAVGSSGPPLGSAASGSDMPSFMM